MQRHNALIRGLANIKWLIKHHKSIGYFSAFCFAEALMGIASYVIADNAHAYLSFTEIFATNLTPSKSFVASFLLTNTFVWGFMIGMLTICVTFAFAVTSVVCIVDHLKDNVNDAYNQKELRHEK